MQNCAEPYLDGLSAAAHEHLLGVFSAFPEIEAVYLYGSRARGDFKPHSDIDLAVQAPDITPVRRANCIQAVEALPLLFPIDIVWLGNIDPAGALYANIKRDSKIFYKRKL